MRSSLKTHLPLSRVAAVLCTLALAAIAAQVAMAQAAPKASSPAGKSSAAAKAPTAAISRKPAAKAAPLSTEEIAAREQVLQSSDWQNTVGEFRVWLGKQTLYDADQVAQIKSRLDSGIARMTADQMHRFMSGMRTKMNVFTSERAEEAQNYLSELLEVASPAYAKRIRQKFPDPLLASASQIDHSLALLVSKRQSTAEMQKRFDQARQQIVEYNKAQTAARQQEIARQQDVPSQPESPQQLKTNTFDYPIGDAFNTGWDGYAGVTWTLGGYRF